MKASSCPPTSAKNQLPLRRKKRKGENPIRLPLAAKLSPISNPWICKNSACRAILTSDDTFCKRCSCCICHLFDDNKDLSLWLFCQSESDKQDSCGLSCHIECALQCQKAGVVDLGQLMQLDGSYCCISCGNVSGILGCWKKQLLIAKDARRADVICYRVSLSYRLLDGTSRFRELNEIVGDAKSKLETEVGPVIGLSAKMVQGIVNRLSVAEEVQNLCSLAIEKADIWLKSISNMDPNNREDSLPSACRFQFEEVTSSSLVIFLKEPYSKSSNSIKSYKLWYCKSKEEQHSKEPLCVFPRTQRRVLITNLQPCTEYTFWVTSYTEAGDLGHFVTKCFTKSFEIIHKNSESAVTLDNKVENLHIEGSSSRGNKEPKTESSGFNVRDLGNFPHLTCSNERNGFDCGGSTVIKHERVEEDQLPFVSSDLDLNVFSVPDLNADLTPPLESSRDEDNGFSSDPVIDSEDNSVSLDMEKNDQAKSNGSSEPLTCTVKPIRELPPVESRKDLCQKWTGSTNEESHENDSTLIHGLPLQFSCGFGHLDRSFEYCVKIIRWLEFGGHIKQEFRMNFLTWFSLRSTEQERWVVKTFIHTLIDDPSSLAGQLMDSFLDIISTKRPRNGFCSTLALNREPH